ncbi:bifunctional riboflavin kinase/FAD synthetase [Marinivivus vitaminiproducens]|uniref:bifunctional riboflavin kinase/FAD synthetase n=1 Tax=Marinivivus vitaminiproducens TaxID=3035935 RepID=UPI00279F0BD9|nr:bifunctional riboflavin kinase/FAD synthetase [Geminicoccaceae bacterium SCSIO 64248]
MRVFRGFQDLPERAAGAVVAIGNFDGVHRGHEIVLARTRAIAVALGLPSGVVTFEPHPLQVLRPATAPGRLTPLRAKLSQLRLLGIDEVRVLPFNAYLMSQPAETFVTDILVRRLGVRHVVVGRDFRFGHKRAGDVDLLMRLAGNVGLGVEILDKVAIEGEVCSSSLIRADLEAGRVERAAERLGRPYALRGRVVEGDRRGRQIGFPTANIRLPGRRPQMTPAAGVYAVRARLHGDGLGAGRPAIANLGWRPTFAGRDFRVEVHVFDFAGDLYGQVAETTFHTHIRDERRFEGIDDLKRQIELDCKAAIRHFRAGFA